jgi:hypothetical protein
VITQPSSARIIEVLQQELSDHIAPALADPAGEAGMQMIQQILSTLAVRVEHEIAWLVEETAAIEAIAARLVDANPRAERVAAALANLRGAPGGSLHLSDVAARYSLASEVLSCLLEDVPTDSELRPEVEAQLDLRLAHEVEVIGDFQLVGRT